MVIDNHIYIGWFFKNKKYKQIINVNRVDMIIRNKICKSSMNGMHINSDCMKVLNGYMLKPDAGSRRLTAEMYSNRETVIEYFSTGMYINIDCMKVRTGYMLKTYAGSRRLTVEMYSNRETVIEYFSEGMYINSDGM